MADKDDDNKVVKLHERARQAAKLQPSAEEIATAAYLVQPALDKIVEKQGTQNSAMIFVILVLVGTGLSFFGGLISVLVRPSGMVLSALGLAVVARSGREVSRLRAVLRLMIAWSPMLIFSIFMILPQTRPSAQQSVIPATVALALVAAGTIWTILRPTRGPHDILARTTIGVR